MQCMQFWKNLKFLFFRQPEDEVQISKDHLVANTGIAISDIT